MTDNAMNYIREASRVLLETPWRTSGRATGLIRPHCPWQNGKVERLNRTLQVEWAYRRIYTTNAARTRALASWATSGRYNTQRPHSALGGRPPISRLS